MCNDLVIAPTSGSASQQINRRSMIAGTASALLGVVLTRPSQAAPGSATSRARAGRIFDPMLGQRFQQTLDDVVAESGGQIPGAVLHVDHPAQGSWSGAAGLGRIEPAVAMRPDDQFAAGSIVKPFVAATVLQLIEDGRFTLDSVLTDVLPADVTSRFLSASEITVRMLMGHRSGLPEWDSAEIYAEVARDPSRIWKPEDLLDLAAAQKQMFPPGTDYAYSNTNYTLLGVIIEQTAGHSWREEATNRVITPLGLAATTLPAPGHAEPGASYAHGYMNINGKMLDVTTIDPSMAGPAGGHALVTAAHDLVLFLNALLAGQLFHLPESLAAMLDFQPASGCPTCEPGQVGYGLGLLQRVLPGGVETIDHLGGAGGYFAYMARVPRQGVTLALAINSSADPSAIILPVLDVVARSNLTGTPVASPAP